MAEMERVINNNFAESLKRNRSALNPVFEYFNSGDSNIDTSDVQNIFSSLLNPLFEQGFSVSDKVINSTFRSVLKLISKGLIGKNGRFKDLENHFYSITGYHKKLLSEHGGLFLINVFNALFNLQEKNTASIDKWASVLCSINPDIDLETFHKSGFILAWRCGAAGGRENAAALIPSLDREILKLIFKIESMDDSTVKKIYDTIISNPWRDPVSAFQKNPDVSPVFTTAGGYRGFGKEFRSLPAAASIEDVIYVTDGIDVFRLHADYFGTELIREKNINPEMIKPGGVINRFIKDGTFIFNRMGYLLPSQWKDGITSIAVSRHSIAWTLRDSCKLYIAGIRGNDGG